MSHPTLSQLYDRLCAARNTLPVGSVIRHYREGGLYEVTDHTIREFDGLPVVTYQAGPVKFSRPVFEIFELVDHEGSIRNRFEVMSND